MSVITDIIGQSNFEIVRAKIASILADEIANQVTLIEAAILAGPTPEELEELEFALSALPDRIWEERVVEPQNFEMPIVNVRFTNDNLDEIITDEDQEGMANYTIEFYANANSSDDYNDKLAATKLHRLIGVCRAILMNPEYAMLGFDFGLIGHKSVQNIRVGQPDSGANDTRSAYMGLFDVKVRLNEQFPIIQGGLLSGIDTTMRLTDEKGYFWTFEND